MDPTSLLGGGGGKKGGRSGGSGGGRSLLGRLGEVFSVHDPRLYDESSLLYQTYLLWALELLFALVFVATEVECTPAGLEMVGFEQDSGFFSNVFDSTAGQYADPGIGDYLPAPLLGGKTPREMISIGGGSTGVRAIPLADRHVCGGSAFVSAGNNSTGIVCNAFHREFVDINCASELKSRGTVLLLGMFLYLVILGVLLGRSKPFVEALNKRVSWIVSRVDAEEGLLSASGEESSARASSELEAQIEERESQIRTVAKRFRRYKIGCIAYFFVAGVGLTTWLFGIGLNRSSPRLCGYHANQWQPFPPYTGYLCTLTRTLPLRLALGAVLIFRALVLLRMIVSVHSLIAFTRGKRWRERGMNVYLPTPLTSFLERGQNTLRSVTTQLTELGGRAAVTSQALLAKEGVSSDGTVCSGPTAAALRSALAVQIEHLRDAAAVGVAEAAREMASALDIPEGEDATTTIAKLAASSGGGVNEELMRRAVEAGLRRALEKGAQ